MNAQATHDGWRWFLRPELGSVVAAALLFTFFGIASSGQLLELKHISGILDQSWPYGVVAIAVGLLVIGGEIDLSTGVMAGTGGAALGIFTTELGMHIGPALVLSLLVCLGLGAFNGIVTVKTGLNSFVVTLGMFFGLRGANVAVSKLITGDALIEGLDEAPGFETLEMLMASVLGTPPADFRVTLFWWGGFMILASWVLLRTRWGNWIFAAGGDPDAARAAGVPVDGTKVALFMLTAGAAWFVGIATAARFTSVQAGQGVGNELFYFIAAVVGGCRIAGGAGSAVGPAIGALIWGIAFTGIPLAGWGSDWRWAFLGVLLLVAASINHAVSRFAERETGQ